VFVKAPMTTKVPMRKVGRSYCNVSIESPFAMLDNICRHRGYVVRDIVKLAFEEAGIVYTTAAYKAFRAGKMRIKLFALARCVLRLQWLMLSLCIARHSTLSVFEPSIRRLMNKHYERRSKLKKR
jgi:hypothetical protein